MKVKTAQLIDTPLDWAVAQCKGFKKIRAMAAWSNKHGAHGGPQVMVSNKEDSSLDYRPSSNWAQGGPIIERENITIIRANDRYIEGKNIPLWFAETDKCVGHNITTGYEGEYFDPCFMVDEAGGCYGPTPLIAAMRCFVASKLGDEIEIPEELL